MHSNVAGGTEQQRGTSEETSRSSLTVKDGHCVRVKDFLE